MSTPTASATLRQLPPAVLEILDRLDPEDSMEALQEMFMTYVRHAVKEGVPEDVHDSVCTVYTELRELILAKTKAPEA